MAEARTRARETKAMAASGVDPVAVRFTAGIELRRQQRAAEFPLTKLVDRYLVEYAEANTRPSSVRAARSLLGQWCKALGNRPATDITKANILSFINDYLDSKAPGEAASRPIICCGRFVTFTNGASSGISSSTTRRRTSPSHSPK